MPIPPPSSREDFKITIICALTLEAKAVVQLFDAIYDESLDQYRKVPGDNNAYTLGSIGKYHVVLVYMPGAGKGYASSVATNVKRSYTCLELALVVGVCGGVPYTKSQTFPRQDIFLGDVIVSKGVVQPRPEILSFLNKLEVGYDRLVNRLATYLTDVQKKFPSRYPGAEKDRLFSPEYGHRTRNCKCAEYTHCDNGIVARQRDHARHDQGVVVHFGLVASGDTVIMSAHDRDQISEIEDIIGFEMEGAGVWENLPCVVIKGVSDYADSHKTKEWQHFAAASAAACARSILDETPVYLPNPSVRISNIDHSQGMPVASCRKRPAVEISESGYEDDFYIESLTFPQAQFRLEEISSAHETTCEWITGRPEYLAWMSEESLPNHGGFFWMKGKPGAGKSTIMKYLLLNAKKRLRDTVLLSFFFHAQGTLLERSVMGMYRSLLHQLLHSRAPPDAKNTFLDVAKRLELQDGDLIWTKRDVKNLLSLTIKSLKGRHILFLIDAVDECDQTEVEDMTTFFQELGKSAVDHTVYLRICLASRHYPHITLDKGIELIVEDQQEHEEDLRKYVETKLKGGRSNVVQDIRNLICKRADGVFLWVMLVVRSLNEAFDRGNISALKKRLDEIPDGLDNLFTDILTRDQKDMHMLIFSLQLILFARRSLTREEVYFAVLFEKTNVLEDYIDLELHSTTVMDRLVLDVTKGLAENAERSRAKPRVRFIHESVRDFLLQRNGLSIIQSQSNDSKSFIGVSHDRLKQFCFDYISGALLLCQPCSGKEFLMLRDTPQGKRQDGSIQEAFPFLDYAIRKVLEHSDLAQAEGISQKVFLRRIF
ncbi:hypothetical protein N7470_007221 [Penicillium chermesinum]|nr:hypothetical protein N7470_007221 [Penicillium chermesinum]